MKLPFTLKRPDEDQEKIQQLIKKIENVIRISLMKNLKKK